MSLRVDMGPAEDLHHEFLGKVGPYFLVRADDDVVFVGIPAFAKHLDRFRIDKGGENATIGAMAKHAVFEYRVRLSKDLEPGVCLLSFHGWYRFSGWGLG